MFKKLKEFLFGSKPVEETKEITQAPYKVEPVVEQAPVAEVKQVEVVVAKPELSLVETKPVQEEVKVEPVVAPVANPAPAAKPVAKKKTSKPKTVAAKPTTKKKTTAKTKKSI